MRANLHRHKDFGGRLRRGAMAMDELNRLGAAPFCED
jgi:hypothetical protein